MKGNELKLNWTIMEQRLNWTVYTVWNYGSYLKTLSINLNKILELPIILMLCVNQTIQGSKLGTKLEGSKVRFNISGD